MRTFRRPGELAFTKGLNDAEAKGYAAGLDPGFKKQHNPYRRYEHRRCWDEGFERARRPKREEATMSHTPGPWRAYLTSVFFPGGAGGFSLRNCPQPEDNARLCAAAPEMLEALRKAEKRLTFLLDGCPDDGDPDWKALHAVRAAIAQAEGKTNG